MTALFDPITIKSITFRNRVGVSPMCQYSAVDGFPNDWHMVHLGARAQGGAGLVMTEATAVEARGRISPGDTGIWSDVHAEAWAPITRFIASQGAVPGIQLAHAGRKASTYAPGVGNGGLADDLGGWEPVAPSAVAFDETYRLPHALTEIEIADIVQAFADAAQRSLDAGFKAIELHGAHGYLMHEFLSPLANKREDEYGGSFENRIRFVLETTRAVRKVWPVSLPFLVRLSSTDWADGAWDLEQSIELSKRLKEEGVDLIDCSSGGIAPGIKIDAKPSYQVPFAEAIRREAGIATAAVGLITEADQAEAIIQAGQADMVFLAREMLRDPYWPFHAATKLGQQFHDYVPKQYGRAFS